MLKLFFLDAAANLALFGLIWYWLGIPVARTSQLAATAALALLIALLAAYLFALAFTREIKTAFTQTPRYLAWLAALALLAAVFLYLRSHAEDLGLSIGSWLTYQMRVPIAPERARLVYEWILLLATAIVFFCWLLPIAARPIAQWRSRPSFAPRYLFLVAAYVLLGLYLPWRLFFWTPELTSYSAQLLSAALRWSAAFTLYVACWLEFARRARATLTT